MLSQQEWVEEKWGGRGTAVKEGGREIGEREKDRGGDRDERERVRERACERENNRG